MPEEITGPGHRAEAVLNLRRSGVKPLRGLPRASETREPLSLNVSELKNGDRRVSARQGRAGGLPLPERLQKLAQIKKSATQYEGLFVDQLVKLMRPSPLTRTPGSETFSELAEQPFRDFLSQAGGMGLANTIVGQIARQEGLEQTLHEHPEVMGPAWRASIPKNLGPKTFPGLTLAPPGLGAQGSDAASPPAPPSEPSRAGEPDEAEIAGPRTAEIGSEKRG